VALLVWQQSRNTSGQTPLAEMATAGSSLPRQNAVLVFGASGKLGRQVVQQVGRLLWACEALSLPVFLTLSKALREAVLQPKPSSPIPMRSSVRVSGPSCNESVPHLGGAQLVRAGRTVVAAVRDAERARDAFAELGLQEGAACQPGQARTPQFALFSDFWPLSCHCIKFWNF